MISMAKVVYAAFIVLLFGACACEALLSATPTVPPPPTPTFAPPKPPYFRAAAGIVTQDAMRDAPERYHEFIESISKNLSDSAWPDLTQDSGCHPAFRVHGSAATNKKIKTTVQSLEIVGNGMLMKAHIQTSADVPVWAQYRKEIKILFVHWCYKNTICDGVNHIKAGMDIQTMFTLEIASDGHIFAKPTTNVDITSFDPGGCSDLWVLGFKISVKKIIQDFVQQAAQSEATKLMQNLNVPPCYSPFINTQVCYKAISLEIVPESHIMTTILGNVSAWVADSWTPFYPDPEEALVGPPSSWAHTPVPKGLRRLSSVKISSTFLSGLIWAGDVTGAFDYNLTAQILDAELDFTAYWRPPVVSIPKNNSIVLKTDRGHVYMKCENPPNTGNVLLDLPFQNLTMTGNVTLMQNATTHMIGLVIEINQVNVSKVELLEPKLPYDEKTEAQIAEYVLLRTLPMLNSWFTANPFTLPPNVEKFLPDAVGNLYPQGSCCSDGQHGYSDIESYCMCSKPPKTVAYRQCNFACNDIDIDANIDSAIPNDNDTPTPTPTIVPTVPPTPVPFYSMDSGFQIGLFSNVNPTVNNSDCGQWRLGDTLEYFYLPYTNGQCVRMFDVPANVSYDFGYFALSKKFLSFSCSDSQCQQCSYNISVDHSINYPASCHLPLKKSSSSILGPISVYDPCIHSALPAPADSDPLIMTQYLESKNCEVGQFTFNPGDTTVSILSSSVTVVNGTVLKNANKGSVVSLCEGPVASKYDVNGTVVQYYNGIRRSVNPATSDGSWWIGIECNELCDPQSCQQQMGDLKLDVCKDSTALSFPGSKHCAPVPPPLVYAVLVMLFVVLLVLSVTAWIWWPAPAKFVQRTFTSLKKGLETMGENIVLIPHLLSMAYESTVQGFHNRISIPIEEFFKRNFGKAPPLTSVDRLHMFPMLFLTVNCLILAFLWTLDSPFKYFSMNFESVFNVHAQSSGKMVSVTSIVDNNSHFFWAFSEFITSIASWVVLFFLVVGFIGRMYIKGIGLETWPKLRQLLVFAAVSVIFLLIWFPLMTFQLKYSIALAPGMKGSILASDSEIRSDIDSALGYGYTGVVLSYMSIAILYFILGLLPGTSIASILNLLTDRYSTHNPARKIEALRKLRMTLLASVILIPLLLTTPAIVAYQALGINLAFIMQFAVVIIVGGCIYYPFSVVVSKCSARMTMLAVAHADTQYDGDGDGDEDVQLRKDQLAYVCKDRKDRLLLVLLLLVSLIILASTIVSLAILRTHVNVDIDFHVFLWIFTAVSSGYMTSMATQHQSHYPKHGS